MESRITDTELALLKTIAGPFERHRLQINKLSEADGEIIDWRGQVVDYLVLKTDGIHEEIQEGLYQNPYLIGWMAVTVVMSDLAAVGADPLGLLLSLQLTQNFTADWLDRFQKGVGEACTTYNVSVLGGDTNFADTTAVNTTAVGTIRGARPLMRKPLAPGELLYTTGRLGGGATLAYARLFDPSLSVNYQPVARLDESRVIRKFATTCIDSSDGLFPALSVLKTLNGTGLDIEPPLQQVLSAETVKVYRAAEIPAWFFMAGPHGEYELLFSIPKPSREAFEVACATAGWQPVLLGRVTATPVVRFTTEDTAVVCDPSEVANLFSQAGGDIQRYFGMLMDKQKDWITHKTAIYANEK
ncbi:MAG: thiamine-phosphate kinase [Flavisolibacter sp.]